MYLYQKHAAKISWNMAGVWYNMNHVCVLIYSMFIALVQIYLYTYISLYF